ncbi:MAG TPA: helix-turn-helix transcriptional regulator [Polyangiaceae bacterium]|nr:helix-turn-helix transcriptional regulator [Polyangiaceae bacterium]
MKPPRKNQASGARTKPRARGALVPSAHANKAEPEKLDGPEGESELHALLAQRVRDARARRFMTRKALAQQSGISLAYLARVESGVGNISLGLLQRLAIALNLPIESFLAAEESPSPDLALLFEFLKRQPPERLARIRRQLLDRHDAAQRIALVGIRGVGKSTLGPLLAERVGAPFVELNREIEKDAGIGVSEIFMLYGQRGYRSLERRCLERIIATCPRCVLATGGGIVAEASTYELLLTSFFTIWLKAEPHVMFERVLAQHDARIASADLRDEALENIARTLEARRHLYNLAPASLDTTRKTVKQIVPALQALLPSASKSRAAER